VKRELELQILDLYRRYPQPRSFAEEVELTAWNGVVINTEDFFMLARPVDIHDPEERWRDAAHTYHRLCQNCWLITIYCGISQNNPCNFAPMQLPFVAWSRRDGRVRVYPTEKIRQRCDTFLHATTNSTASSPPA
jgi:hypothetical protein